jgi:hypothetical protein
MQPAGPSYLVPHVQNNADWESIAVIHVFNYVRFRRMGMFI